MDFDDLPENFDDEVIQKEAQNKIAALARETALKEAAAANPTTTDPNEKSNKPSFLRDLTKMALKAIQENELTAYAPYARTALGLPFIEDACQLLLPKYYHMTPEEQLYFWKKMFLGVQGFVSNFSLWIWITLQFLLDVLCVPNRYIGFIGVMYFLFIRLMNHVAPVQQNVQLMFFRYSKISTTDNENNLEKFSKTMYLCTLLYLLSPYLSFGYSTLCYFIFFIMVYLPELYDGCLALIFLLILWPQPHYFVLNVWVASCMFFHLRYTRSFEQFTLFYLVSFVIALIIPSVTDCNIFGTMFWTCVALSNIHLHFGPSKTLSSSSSAEEENIQENPFSSVKKKKQKTNRMIRKHEDRLAAVRAFDTTVLPRFHTMDDVKSWLQVVYDTFRQDHRLLMMLGYSIYLDSLSRLMLSPDDGEYDRKNPFVMLKLLGLFSDLVFYASSSNLKMTWGEQTMQIVTYLTLIIPFYLTGFDASYLGRYLTYHSLIYFTLFVSPHMIRTYGPSIYRYLVQSATTYTPLVYAKIMDLLKEHVLGTKKHESQPKEEEEDQEEEEDEQDDDDDDVEEIEMEQMVHCKK